MMHILLPVSYFLDHQNLRALSEFITLLARPINVVKLIGMAVAIRHVILLSNYEFREKWISDSPGYLFGK